MPRQLSHATLESLVEAVARFPDGAPADEIERKLRPVPSHRTLQRHLSLLVTQGVLAREGEGRASRYHLPARVMETPPQPSPRVFELQLSSVGLGIRASVREPIQLRQPVGYQRAFLENYRPNETAYLSPAVRKHLSGIASIPGGKLPPGTHARKVFDRLLIDLSWNSSRLEGNTYSLLETDRLLVLGESAEGKTAEEARMILNHKAAIELLVDEAEAISFNRYTLLNLHALLSDSLLHNQQASGRLRTIPVMIGGTVFRPLDVPAIIEEFFDRILATAAAIADPFEQAFFVMVQLPYLQPFEDVNKRVSRLAANIPLIQHNLCPLSFVGVPTRDYIDGLLGVYELNRVDLLREVFIWAYERSCDRYGAVRALLGTPDPFRLRYRTILGALVGEIIHRVMTRQSAVDFIHREVAACVPLEDQAKLIEMIETEILCLHEGNFARYRATPSEFQRWREQW